MNKSVITFLKRVAILLLVIILIDIGLGKVLEHYYLKMKSGQTARITYAMTEANEKLFVFGSSRANHHYVPGILEDSLHISSYNAGVDGQGILFHYALLKSITHRSQPQVILLDLNINEFEQAEISYDKLYALLPYYRSDKNIRSIADLRSPYEPVKTFSNLYRYNSFILPILLNNAMNRADNSIKGYVPLDRTLDTSKAFPVLKRTAELDPVKINTFKSFIRDAGNLNCKVLVFISPLFKNTDTISSTIKLAERFCNEEHISFADYSQSPFFDQHPAYFQDPQHLNKAGSEIYTRLILKDIEKVISNRP